MAVTVFVVLRDLPPSGGARTASPPPACISSRGGSPGQTASVCLAFRSGRRQAGGGARTASPSRLHMLAGRQSGSDGQCLSRVSARRSGNAVPVTVFVVPGDLPPSGGARTASPPRLHMLAGGQSGSDGKCLFRVSARRSGKAVPATVFVVPGDLPPSGGARTASPPRLHTLAGGQPGSDGKCSPRIPAVFRQGHFAWCWETCGRLPANQS